MSNKKTNKQTVRKGNKKSLVKNESAVKKAEVVKKKKPLLKVTFKILLLAVFVFLGLYYSDNKGYFNSNERLDYISKGWDAFGRFTEKNNVDVILLGNSHMFANISPKNVSIALGVNAFSIGGPGSAPHDLYFSLKEALKKCKPSLIVFETYCIRNTPLHQTIPFKLSHQLNSFTGRNDIPIKLISTPVLFETGQYGYAWSKTIRNHNYLFSNKQQLQNNKALIKERKHNKKPVDQSLYLGQLVYYTQGMHDTTVRKFNTIEPLIDGKDFVYNKYDEKYTDKIMDLCEANNIEVMFFTNPMYPKVIKDYGKWKNTLNKLLSKYDKKWLDLQENCTAVDFPPICFQNSYKHKNQHLTHLGSLVSAYKLADFINNNYRSILPNRKKNNHWHQTFYGQDGYFMNFSPAVQDKRNRSIRFSFTQEHPILKEVIASQQKRRNQEFTTIIAKVDEKSFGLNPNTNNMLLLTVRYLSNGTERSTTLQLPYNIFYKPENTLIYTQNIQSINIISIDSYRFVSSNQ